MKYYDVRDTIKEFESASIFYIVGQGGVGKSYSIKRLCVLNWFEKRKKFIYVKRYTTEIMGGALDSVFSDIEEDAEVIDAFKDFDPTNKYHTFHILQQGSYFVLKGEFEDGTMEVIDKIGRIVAVSKATTFKGGVYNDANIIFFDEFITEEGYVRKDKEPSLFAKIVGTVGRIGNDGDLKIFMCGNPDASIEMNPYLYTLSLDYERMQPNTAYAYDTIEENGHRIANNRIFIKLAKYNGDTFLNKKTGQLFGTAEELARIDGRVKTNKYIHVDYKSDFEPLYELVVETPIIAENEYHKKIYVYYGVMWNEPVCVVCNHKEYNEINSLYCRYDSTDFRKRPTRQTFRINIPNEDTFSDLKRYISVVDDNKLFISKDDGACTLYEQIRLNS